MTNEKYLRVVDIVLGHSEKPAVSALPWRWVDAIYTDERRSDPVRTAFRKSCRDFYRHLARYHSHEMLMAGVPEDAIEGMYHSPRCPTGFDLHHKIPVSWGGTNDPNNIILMPRPAHEQLHRILYPMSHWLWHKGEMRLFIPWPTGVVYQRPQAERPATGRIQHMIRHAAAAAGAYQPVYG